jgi:hypothetical protein
MGMQIDAISLNPRTSRASTHHPPGDHGRLQECTRRAWKHTVSRTNRLVRDTIIQKFPDELMFFHPLDQEEAHGLIFEGCSPACPFERFSAMFLS